VGEVNHRENRAVCPERWLSKHELMSNTTSLKAAFCRWPGTTCWRSSLPMPDGDAESLLNPLLAM
jgi:hypothetical protein